MGDGVIDGRGYAKILGKDYSWWEMARKAEPKNERYFTTADDRGQPCRWTGAVPDYAA